MKRALGLLVVLVLVAAGSWWYFTKLHPPSSPRLTIYYTKMDGSALGTWSVSERPAQPLRDMVQYAAVSAVAGPPSEVPAIRFPPGTQVNRVDVAGSTASIDLSDAVGRQATGSFEENGEFKGLVYTVTGVPGITAVQVTVAGRRVETLPGGHLELDQPLQRSDW